MPFLPPRAGRGFALAPFAYAAAGLVSYLSSFAGFGDVAQTAEEVEDVKRVLPRAMWIALIVVFVFYSAVPLRGSSP